MTSRLCFLFGLLCLFDQAFGHGAMYYPNPWWATSACSAENGPYGEGCSYIHEVPTEEPKCRGKGAHWRQSGCSFTGGLTAWFTNYTGVEDRTIRGPAADDPEMDDTRFKTDMMVEWTDGVMVQRDGPAIKTLHPWNSPGSAPVHGGGCGANGGNPYGCIGNPDDTNGRCCGGAFKKQGKRAGGGEKWSQGCGGFSNGKSALEWYKNRASVREVGRSGPRDVGVSPTASPPWSGTKTGQACGRWGEVVPGMWGFLQRQVRPGVVQKRAFRERGWSTGYYLVKRKRAACDLGIKCLP